MSGSIWLLPNTLGGADVAAVIPEAVLWRTRQLRFFLVEEPKSARAYLKFAGHPGPMASLRIEQLTNDTSADQLANIIESVAGGLDAGILSEAGCPALADPGATLIRLAHRANLRVMPLSGPSSITLALMASGLDTQRFAFHGYLPIKEPDRSRAIKKFEERSRTERETQIFIETPYRNKPLLAALLAACREDSLLCLACDLTLTTEFIFTMPVGEWKKRSIALDHRPCVFLFLAEGKITRHKHP